MHFFLFGIDCRMDGRRGYGAAQTKDFSLQVSFYFGDSFFIHISIIFPRLTCNPSGFSVCMFVWYVCFCALFFVD
jgi:hypothetical protein